DHENRTIKLLCCARRRIEAHAEWSPGLSVEVVEEQRPVIAAPLSLRAQLGIPAAGFGHDSRCALLEIDQHDLRRITGHGKLVLIRQPRESDIAAGWADRRSVKEAMNAAIDLWRDAPDRRLPHDRGLAGEESVQFRIYPHAQPP